MQPNQSSKMAAVATIAAILAGLAGLIVILARTVGEGTDSVGKSVANLTAPDQPLTFKADQLLNGSVQQAMEKAPALAALAQEKGLSYPPARLYVRVFEQEKEVEVWGASADEGPFVLLRAYPLCRMEETSQPAKKASAKKTLPTAPVGFYRVDRFFPKDMRYVMAMRVDFPNEADKRRVAGDRRATARLEGQDLFFKGGCADTGYFHIGDDSIQELYVLGVEATQAGQQAIPVHLFPARMTAEATAALEARAGRDKRSIQLLESLKLGYDRFEQDRRPPSFTIDASGSYSLAAP